jgi:DnaK suppressor protein
VVAGREAGGDSDEADGAQMDESRARELLLAERADVRKLLAGAEEAAQEDRSAEGEVGDSADPAQALTAEGMDSAIAESMRNRLAAIDRALRRLDEGSYGRSVRSGKPIPDARLEADPAAELTVEEASS